MTSRSSSGFSRKSVARAANARSSAPWLESAVSMITGTGTWDAGPKLRQDGDAVQVRHYQVEEDQIGLECFAESQGLSRVHRSLEMRVAFAPKEALEESHGAPVESG
jgi:hypothetical protein